MLTELVEVIISELIRVLSSFITEYVTVVIGNGDAVSAVYHDNEDNDDDGDDYDDEGKIMKMI